MPAYKIFRDSRGKNADVLGLCWKVVSEVFHLRREDDVIFRPTCFGPS